MMSRPIALITAALLLLSALMQPAAAETAAVPLRFNVKKRVASVAVERGVEQIVLERKSGAGWKPLAVSYPRATGWGSVRVASFNLPTLIPASELRAQGYRGVKFPARFLKGKRAFDRKDLSGGGLMMATSGVVGATGGNMVLNSVAAVDAKATTSTVAVESDIWQIVGDQVYFFNQYRGLQILDLSDPTLPVRVGSLRLPASGEQMFVLDDTGSTVALLGRSNDKARQGAATIWLIRVTDGVPALVGEVPLEGAITDSRLIGSTLHVLCSVYSAVANNWTSEAVLTSIDLANLESPQKLGALRFPSYNAVLQASQGYLLIGTENYTSGQQRGLHVINVDAAPVVEKSFTPRGQIQDKFKVSIVNGAVVAVTLDWQNWSNRQTWVETFPLAGSDVAPLSALELVGARNEQLYATRFDGDRLYVVTFRNIDPLFIVDLADPAAPVLSGVLEVPGWSTYLEPLGDRLLAVGVEAGRVTVSLFDVADVTTPTLLSRLPLGAEGTHSWSEATYDEKAVEYLPAQGVVMVPFQTWSWGAGGAQKAIQIVNVGADALTAGATINHSFNPRRGSWIAGHFVTISGQELLVHGTDTASAAPEVTLSLAWRTDRVVPFGNFLVQIEDGSTGWYGGYFLRIGGTYGSTNARLRITPASDPDSLVETIDLGAGRVVGITQKDNRLYLAQWVPATDTAPQMLRTLSLELGSPPSVTELGRAEHDLTGLSEYQLNLDALQPLWTDAQTLVWYIPMQSQRWWWWGPIYVMDSPVLRIQPAVTILGTTSPTLTLATTNAPPPPAQAPVQVSNPAAVLCPVTVTQSGVSASQAQTVSVKGSLRGTSSAFVEAGFIFFSYDITVEQPVANVKVKPTASLSLFAATTRMVIPYAPYEWRVASWLQVVDWRTATPVLRDPVSIPGQLLSVAQADAQGAVILTNSDQQISNAAPATRVIQASGYDGISAWQLDNYITSTPFYTASATDGTRVYLARETGAVGVVGIGYNATTGRLAQINTWTTTEVPSMLNVASGHLLTSSYGNLEVASIAAATGVMTPVASFDTPTNLWLQVNRAAFTPTLDLWIPAADYGVEFLQHAAMQ